jgi:lysophospholipase L1-like esterase
MGDRGVTLGVAAIHVIALAAPAVPALLLVWSGSRWATLFTLVWAALAAGVFVTRPWAVRNAAVVAYAGMACLPYICAAIWFSAAPIMHLGSLRLLAITSLLPPSVLLMARPLGRRLVGVPLAGALGLPVASMILGLLMLEAAGALLLPDPFRGNAAATSPDGSYWYIVDKRDAQGAQLATSFGFLGPEPAPSYEGRRVLLIGDSIPAADRVVNFPLVAQEVHRGSTPLEIINASVSGYSLAQMRAFYASRLTLRHDILVVSFYIDDVNRELRYRRRNFLYTPSWPRWMQDAYYRCLSCNALLRLIGFSDNTFLLYRTRSIEAAFPDALDTLNAIRELAIRRGAIPAILNIPAFRWKATLSDASAYEFAALHQRVEQWAAERGVFYHDVLPALVGVDIARLRISDDDIHFNDEGHRLVGRELQRLLHFVMHDMSSR